MGHRFYGGLVILADLTSALAKITAKSKEAPTLSVTYKHGSETKEITVQPKKDGNRYLLGVSPTVKTGFWDKVIGGFTAAWATTVRILSALKDIVFNFNINKLGGPVSIFINKIHFKKDFLYFRL